MTAKFPEGSKVRDEIALPPSGGRLVIEDSDGNEVRSWTLLPIVDDQSIPIDGAKYMIACSPAAIAGSVSTPEGGGGQGSARRNPKGGTP